MKNKGFDHSSLTDRTLPLLFSILMQTGQHPIPIATITPTPLTDEQKQALQTEFYDSWYGHIVNGSCSNGFGCGNMTWPTP